MADASRKVWRPAEQKVNRITRYSLKRLRIAGITEGLCQKSPFNKRLVPPGKDLPNHFPQQSSARPVWRSGSIGLILILSVCVIGLVSAPDIFFRWHRIEPRHSTFSVCAFLDIPLSGCAIPQVFQPLIDQKAWCAARTATGLRMSANFIAGHYGLIYPSPVDTPVTSMSRQALESNTDRG